MLISLQRPAACGLEVLVCIVVFFNAMVLPFVPKKTKKTRKTFEWLKPKRINAKTQYVCS